MRLMTTATEVQHCSRVVFASLVTVIAILIPTVSQGIPLGSYSFHLETRTNGDPADSYPVFVAAEGQSGEQRTVLFSLSTSTEGSSYILDEGSAFDRAVALFTDGSGGDILEAYMNHLSWMGYGFYQVDFSEFLITSFELIVNDLSWWTDGYGDGAAWSTYTLIVHGEAAAPVPEPSSIVLVSAGLLGLLGLGRHRPRV